MVGQKVHREEVVLAGLSNGRFEGGNPLDGSL